MTGDSRATTPLEREGHGSTSMASEGTSAKPLGADLRAWNGIRNQIHIWEGDALRAALKGF